MLISEEEHCYVGSSTRVASRSNYLRYRTNNWKKYYWNNNGRLTFYNAVLEQGWSKFKFGILEYIDLNNIENSVDRKKFLLEKEQYYLNFIKPSLNICKIAGSPLGIKHDTMFSENLSKARRGKK